MSDHDLDMGRRVALACGLILLLGLAAEPAIRAPLLAGLFLMAALTATGVAMRWQESPWRPALTHWDLVAVFLAASRACWLLSAPAPQ